MGSSLPDTPQRLYLGEAHTVCTRARGERGSGPLGRQVEATAPQQLSAGV